MALSTRPKRPKASLVKQETIGHAIAFLQELPNKPKEDLSLREAVEQMQASIKESLSKGYSYDDIAKMLSEKGIKISALTLKNYAPSGRRQASKTKPGRARKTAAAETAETSTATAPIKGTRRRKAASEDGSSETTPAAAKPRRGGRAKATAAKATAENGTTVKPARSRRSSTAKTEAKPTSTRRRRSAKSAE